MEPQTQTTAANLIRKYYSAYETKDRGAIEELLNDDFTFTSPLDYRIDRPVYFERCSPNSENIRAFQIEESVNEFNLPFIERVGN